MRYVLIVALLLTGCHVAPIRSYCEVAKPLLVSCDAKGCNVCSANHDCLTDITSREILTHNDTYSRLCPER